MVFNLIKYMLALLFNEVNILQKKITKKSSKDKGKKNKNIKTKKKAADGKKNAPEIQEEASTRKPEIIGIAFVAVGLISICGLLGFNVGYIGLYFAKFLKYFLGIGAAVASLLFVVCGGYYIMQHKKIGINKTSIGIALLLISILGMYHHILIPVGKEILPESLADGGGLVGGLLSLILHKPLGSTGTTIVYAAAIIGSILLATPWSLASGIIYTKEASEMGAEAAMDVAEAVYDGAKNVGSRVQNQVGEQVQKLKKKSFYDQAQDDSFSNDGPIIPAGEEKAADTGDIEPIIKLDGSSDLPSWQAPEPIMDKRQFDGPDMEDGFKPDNTVNQMSRPASEPMMDRGRFDGPDMNGYTGQAVSGEEQYISEFAQRAAGNLNKNLNNLDTSGFVNVKENKIPEGTFDNWRLRGNDPEEVVDPMLTEDELARFNGLGGKAPDSDNLAVPEQTEDDSEQVFNFKDAIFSNDVFDDVDEAPEEPEPENPMVVESLDKLLSDYDDEGQGESQAASEVSQNNDDLNDGFAIEFSSDNAGESSFTKSLPEDEIEQPDTDETSVDTEEAEEPAAQAETGGAVSEAEQADLPPYEVPDVNLILEAKNKEKDDELEKEISDKAKVLAQTLKDFKVNASILSACHGPAVTRYEVKLSPGVKVNKLTGLADDIALSMAASSVRIEQIPNRSTIGIEVPNRKLESVQLREVLENNAFKEAKSNLTVGFGKDISGKAIFANLADMPHLLVAGATGSGKSVCINTIVTSILFKAKPDEVKFIMIDPKMVELSVYNDIPHLMVPVVTDSRKAAAVLNWSVQEMEKRYGLIAEAGVRNVETYNQYYAEDKAKQLPSVVIIIDELADLMMVAPHDVEDAICRLAQKARAAGIYLVLATQRPSVNVITGVIKANIPSRISFAVTSQIDSRTILDSAGAEKLLGKGDMLFKPQTEPKAVRVQGAFVSDAEVERLVESIKQQGHKCEINQEIIDFTNRADSDAEDGEVNNKGNVDELLRQAVELVMQTGNASASSFQRRYHIGYTRAGRLLDTMEQLKIVGPPQGSKPREILVTEDQAFEIMDKLEEYLKEAK